MLIRLLIIMRKSLGLQLDFIAFWRIVVIRIDHDSLDALNGVSHRLLRDGDGKHFLIKDDICYNFVGRSNNDLLFLEYPNVDGCVVSNIFEECTKKVGCEDAVGDVW